MSTQDLPTSSKSTNRTGRQTWCVWNPVQELFQLNVGTVLCIGYLMSGVGFTHGCRLGFWKYVNRLKKKFNMLHMLFFQNVSFQVGFSSCDFQLIHWNCGDEGIGEEKRWEWGVLHQYPVSLQLTELLPFYRKIGPLPLKPKCLFRHKEISSFKCK